jgi:nitroimidazol reductase NimA-like FMN-containing flavoprotein (pyridoxamine 5'-phosphate oxidase superfamily)
VTYPITKDNRPSRHPERASYDKAVVHGILDAGLLAHVGFVVEGRPRVLPMLYVRREETLYLHGSTGSRINRGAARSKGVDLCVEVTLFDELVLARSSFNHSVNYRSVVMTGEATVLEESSEKKAVLDLLVERLVPGRSADARPPSEPELRQTGVLALRLAEVSAKVRSGDPVDEESDLQLSCWAGVLPIKASFGAPRPSADLASAVELPPYLRALGNTAPPL